MSAYVVDRGHINFMIHAAKAGRNRPLRWRSPNIDRHRKIEDEHLDMLGTMLWEENIKSVMFRYPGDDRLNLPGPIGESFDFSYKFMHLGFNPIDVIKAVHCYVYQSCEHPGWEESEARNFVESLEAKYVRMFDGYEDAKWGYPNIFRIEW